MRVVDDLARAREAFERREWLAAYEGLSAVGDDRLFAADFADLAISAFLFLKAPRLVDAVAKNPLGALLRRFWFNAWGFDWLYDQFFRKPYLWFIRVNAKDGIDVAIGFIPTSLRALHGALARTQTGQIRWYAMGMATGAVVVIGMVLL